MRYQREVKKQREEVGPLPVDFMDDTEKLQVYNIIQSKLTVLNVPFTVYRCTCLRDKE